MGILNIWALHRRRSSVGTLVPLLESISCMIQTCTFPQSEKVFTYKICIGQLINQSLDVCLPHQNFSLINFYTELSHIRQARTKTSTVIQKFSCHFVCYKIEVQGPKSVMKNKYFHNNIPPMLYLFCCHFNA